ncbi:hypothetical protein [Blastomonas sp. CACIA14H2]|uniref:hypothetical protein n=1 Tax=Blastomonas sp. CACIA14H2 TaxID=1419876 RepID=UPI004058BD3F
MTMITPLSPASLAASCAAAFVDSEVIAVDARASITSRRLMPHFFIIFSPFASFDG